MNKKKNSMSYLTVFLIAFLVLTFFIGKLDIAAVSESEEGTSPRQLRLLSLGDTVDHYINLGKDLTSFIRDYKKLNLFTLDKTLRQQIIPEIENYESKLQKLKSEEQQINKLISSIPTEEYVHNKIELSSFIVDELKKQNLIYEINYNFSNETEDANSETQTENNDENTVLSPYTNQIMIKIYQIDKDDNYNKMLAVMDSIFIREPYEIKTLKMLYDKDVASYYLMLVIEV